MRRDIQRTQLIADGRKALDLINAGKPIADVLMIVPGSRARLYRAMAAALQTVAESDAAYQADAELQAALEERDRKSVV